MDIQDIVNSSSLGGGVNSDATAVDEARTQFLTLLLAQLQYQDPMSPMDTDQMTAQMMSLGQLEQLFNLNEGVDKLVDLTSTSQIASFSGMVGKEALSQGNVLQVDGDKKGSIFFKLDQIPRETTIRIFDQFGSQVNSFPHQVNNVGLQEIAFNGQNLNQDPLPDGYYTYTVEPLTNSGDLIPTTTYAAGKISSIRVESGVPVFEMGGNDIAVSDIERIF